MILVLKYGIFKIWHILENQQFSNDMHKEYICCLNLLHDYEDGKPAKDNDGK